ncbi:Dimethylaniline monooxygenase (N-oxide forming) [Penicillium sp. IBT 35674x]|nr:Dimethylaniline monooxygenase (N-oxide forming) [Penicillium sp. IBT 35674x]
MGSTAEAILAVPAPRPQDRVEIGSVNIPVGKFPDSPSTASDQVIDAICDELIERFNTALTNRDHTAISFLFLEDGYWRDHLAISWDLRTLKRRNKIRQYLDGGHQILSLGIDRTSAFRRPQLAPLDGISDPKGIQFFIRFATELGSGRGAIRLVHNKNGAWRILSLFTSLEAIKGCEEPLGVRRSKGTRHDSTRNGKNWRDMREEQMNFTSQDPTVLIIGAGQGGLSIAAHLKMLGSEALVIDTENEVGDNWRRRYHQLVLHDPVWFNHMPYMKFPDHWPVFTPKDKMAEFLELYAKAMELNIWTRAKISSSHWSETRQCWNVTICHYRKDGSHEVRDLHPRFIVQATGHSGKMNLPDITGMANFQGDRLCHSSEFPGADVEAGKKGKNAIVIGSCNSAHDIAQDFFNKGFEVTMIQRSSTCVVSSEAIVKIGLSGLYAEDGPPVEDSDLWLWGLPSELLKAQQVKVTALQNEHDAKTLDGLEKAGFKVDRGPNDAGLLMKYFQRGGGYYIDIGASQLIVDGKIKVRQGVEIDEILPNGLRLKDNSVLPADEIVFATGYLNMRTQTQAIFGDEVADRVQDIWGYDEEGEMRTIWRRSGHPGLWFMGGNLALSRYYSRMLGLQIRAAELGLFK